mmetsp:Transcript_6811/g.16438  ORF Transcript_6811/g.16438 Transcript_6811/m.16438 type:complete len:217 (-) Transcript_6811:407-1057(-)
MLDGGPVSVWLLVAEQSRGDCRYAGRGQGSLVGGFSPPPRRSLPAKKETLDLLQRREEVALGFPLVEQPVRHPLLPSHCVTALCPSNLKSSKELHRSCVIFPALEALQHLVCGFVGHDLGRPEWMTFDLGPQDLACVCGIHQLLASQYRKKLLWLLLVITFLRSRGHTVRYLQLVKSINIATSVVELAPLETNYERFALTKLIQTAIREGQPRCLF